MMMIMKEPRASSAMTRFTALEKTRKGGGLLVSSRKRFFSVDKNQHLELLGKCIVWAPKVAHF